MRGKWLNFLKRTHLYLSVFFSPLLLMFILTGWWQLSNDSDAQEDPKGAFNQMMSKFSSVHTESKFPMPNSHHSPWVMKFLAVLMCIALIISILLGLFMAWQTIKKKWLVAGVFVLGIVLPAAALFLI